MQVSEVALDKNTMVQSCKLYSLRHLTCLGDVVIHLQKKDSRYFVRKNSIPADLDEPDELELVVTGLGLYPADRSVYSLNFFNDNALAEDEQSGYSELIKMPDMDMDRLDTIITKL